MIAHSLGSVIAFNCICDFQAIGDKYLADTPLERGETLRYLYTMGSPLALYALRYEDTLFGHPPKVAVWKNFIDKADIIAYPLHDLNEFYKVSGVEDIQLEVGSVLTSWNPMSHIEYWTDPKIIAMITNDLITK